MIYLTNANLALAFDPGVEFDEQPEQLSGLQALIEHIKKAGKVPFNRGEIFWHDDSWDFSEFVETHVRRSEAIFSFENSGVYEDVCKSFVLFQILENRNKVQTIKKHYNEVNRFLRYCEDRGFVDVEDITTAAIREYLNEFKNVVTEGTYRKMVFSIRTFFVFYAINISDSVLDGERKKLFDSAVDKTLLAQERINNRFPDIPKPWFSKFLSGAISIATDTRYKKSTRAMANLFIILSQTGLRIGECLALEVGQLETTIIFEDTKAHFLRYNTWKSSHGNNNQRQCKTYVNELTKGAYDRLVKLYKEERKELKTSLLFLGETTRHVRLPYNATSIAALAERFYIELDKHVQTIDVPKSQQIDLTTRTIKHGSNEGHTITYPCNHQYRVHVCTELYHKGVPLEYINEFMAHLSSEMKDYYVRPSESNLQEDMDYSRETIEGIVTGEFKVLGGKDADDLNNRILKFVEDGNYNVKKDMKEICDDLVKLIPIRQKTGGVCIKSSVLRDCSMDAATNEMYCAYGVCPNLYHFFYMANVSYRQAKELLETIDINRQNGFMRQVQKEVNLLHNIVRNKLEPELCELKKQMEKNGAEHVMIKYPDLIEIVMKYDQIMEEVEEWKGMSA